eukprot:11017374-Alexandrium_andersonii.AAC.1
MRSMAVVLSQIKGMCTDMGTEMGIPDAMQASLDRWFAFGMGPPSALREDSAEQVDADFDAACSSFVFPECLGAPGLCHITDNMTKDLVNNALVYGERFIELLSAMSDLVSNRTYKERFVQRCLRDAGHREWVDVFEPAFRTVKEWLSLIHI